MNPREEALRLAEERAVRRRRGDYEAADILRTQIEALGFTVEDGAGSFGLAERAVELPAEAARLRPQDVVSVLRREPEVDVTIHWIAEGWPEDVLRGVASFQEHIGGRSIQHVVAESVPVRAEWPDAVEVVRLREGLGWARARNAGLERSEGRMVVIVDGSVEAAGDVLGPLESALADPSVGIVGPVGVVTEGLHEFVPAEGTECDAIEGYLMAFRRELLVGGLRFDPGFRFYRSADLELSFQVKALGLRAVMVDVPIERHEHRMWWTTSPEDRARWSKRNYYRFLDRWRGRTDLTVAGRSGQSS